LFHQAYQACLQITYSLTIDPIIVYPGIASSRAKSAMHILEIALQSFFDDTKQLVADGVHKDIALCLF
jgi:hypothetical protein